MGRKAVIGAASAALIVVIGFSMALRGALAQGQPGFHCTDATIRGTFGVQMQGRAPVPPPFPPGTQDVIGVVVRTYDGQGSFSQVDNIKGSVTGLAAPDRPGGGTYSINPDCSGIAVFDPGSGMLIEERLVVVDKGNEIRTITGNPPPLMVTAVHTRIDHR